MKLIAKDSIIYGAKKFKAGEIIEIDDKTAKKFLSLKWCEKVEEAEKPKTTKKKK